MFAFADMLDLLPHELTCLRARSLCLPGHVPSLDPPADVHDQADQKQDEEQDKQDLCNSCRCHGDTAKAKNRCQYGDQKENQCIVKHGLHLHL